MGLNLEFSFPTPLVRRIFLHGSCVRSRLLPMSLWVLGTCCCRPALYRGFLLYIRPTRTRGDACINASSNRCGLGADVPQNRAARLP